MSLIPSPLNPIHFFGQDEPIYWKVNKFGADRGGYTRKWPVNTPAQIYVEASSLPTGAIVACDNSATLMTLTFTLVSGTTYVSNQILLYDNPKNVYLLISRAVYVNIFTAPVPTSFAGVTHSTWAGIQVPVKNPTLLKTISIGLNLTVAMTQGIEIGVFRVDPSNRAKLIQVESIIDNSLIGLTGAQTLILDPVSGAAMYGYNVDDFYTIAVRAVNPGEFFQIPITTLVASAFTTGMLISINDTTGQVTFETRTQPSISIDGYESVVSEVLDARFHTSNASYTQQTLVKITSQNVKAYLGIPANTLLTNWVLADFWKRSHPQMMEDIETSPGEFTRLVSEAYRNKQLNTSYRPAYSHYQLLLQLGCDGLKVDDVDYILRPGSEYTFNNENHYQLSMGSVILTERKSITRNTI